MTAGTQGKPRILCVDDEPEVLRGLKLNLRKVARVSTAESGAEGLELLRSAGPFDIVISDMRMPEMNGAAFLSAAREGWPDTERILLTGQTDVESAVAAVNDGAIFRFLTKPCPPDLLHDTVEAALEQKRLRGVERELLEGTLRAALKVLGEVLSLVSPPAFQCAMRLEDIVRQLAMHLELPDSWQYTVAATLSQVGCVSLPTDLLDRVATGDTLDADEAETFAKHAALAKDLVSRIPRLEAVAEMVGGQLEPTGVTFHGKPASWEPGALGAELLRLALAFDRQTARGDAPDVVWRALRDAKTHPKVFIDALEGVEVQAVERVQASVPAAQLAVGMVLDEDALNTAGMVVAAKGTELNATIVQRLHNFAEGVGLQEPLRVWVPSGRPVEDGS